MEIPKYIDGLIDERAFYAKKLLERDSELSWWIDRNGIEVRALDYDGGIEVYVNPTASAERIRQAILR